MKCPTLLLPAGNDPTTYLPGGDVSILRNPFVCLPCRVATCCEVVQIYKCVECVIVKNSFYSFVLSNCTVWFDVCVVYL